MPDIAWTAPELTGETGLMLYLYTTAGVLINTDGDALSESPASSGRFVATVAESISAIASARLHDAVGPVRDGWLAVGSTLVQDEYPVTSSGGGDALEATSQDILNIVEGLAASPSISVSSPVVSLDQSGLPVQIEVVQGADYVHATGTAISLNITGTFPTWAGGTAVLVINCGTELTVAGTIVTATGGTRSVRFDITDTQTAALIGSDPESPTKHTDAGWFDLKVTLSGGDVTYPINRGKFISRRRVV